MPRRLKWKLPGQQPPGRTLLDWQWPYPTCHVCCLFISSQRRHNASSDKPSSGKNSGFGGKAWRWRKEWTANAPSQRVGPKDAAAGLQSVQQLLQEADVALRNAFPAPHRIPYPRPTLPDSPCAATQRLVCTIIRAREEAYRRPVRQTQPSRISRALKASVRQHQVLQQVLLQTPGKTSQMQPSRSCNVHSTSKIL
jgi:hypothetical protein